MKHCSESVLPALVVNLLVALFVVVSSDSRAQQRERPWDTPAGALMKRLDADRDGRLSRKELGGAKHLRRCDTNRDGFVDTDELRKLLEKRRDRPWQGKPATIWERPGAETESAPEDPYEDGEGFVSRNCIDELALQLWTEKGITPANPCSDAVFVRRVFLDVIGTLPTARETRAFLDDPSPTKRVALIETLMEREEFADYWALKWCDLLRVKAEFPINLWPNAVQAYHHWIRESVRTNKPYDQFARELLTSSGSNFRVPPVNFYRAIQGQEPSTIAASVALTLMGTRLERWPEAERKGLETFFSRVAYKGTAEWKEQIVFLDPSATTAITATFPGGEQVTIPATEDPRIVFADWLLKADNPWFARAIVNRVWAWLLGRGIIHEPDDIRPDNPAALPTVLARLGKELVDAGYDLRRVYQLILTSGLYQQSCIPQSDNPSAETMFAHYPVRRLDAEVLIDALCWIAGDGEGYSSAIPEPFTFIPEHQRTIALADGSITSQFLEMFGRPPRDTGLEAERNNEPTDAQRLHLLNSTHVQEKIEKSHRLRAVVNMAKGNPRVLTQMLYVMLLSRSPTERETATVVEYLRKGGKNLSRGGSDVAWALINSKEFLYRH